MTVHDLGPLADLLETEHAKLLARWRKQVATLPAAKHLDAPTLNDHIPAFLGELAAAFRLGSSESIPEALIENSPAEHGVQRLADGFDIVEVVAEYNILRGAIHDLVVEHGLVLSPAAFHIVNRALDRAIGLSVQTFAEQQALDVKRRREEYLAFVAHDLRTPLNAIALSARVLELGPLARDEKMLKTLQRNVKRLEGLVDSVLKESMNVQTEMGLKLERRELDLWPLVEALVHDLHPIAGTSSTALVNAIPEELTAYGDASLLRRVFQNLIANAIRYTPRGEIVIGAQDIAGGVECWVTDDGLGVALERRELIFEKLETDPERDGGTGLGLAIVKTFIEGHGGTVTVESNADGAGTTFRFTLPDPR